MDRSERQRLVDLVAEDVEEGDSVASALDLAPRDLDRWIATGKGLTRDQVRLLRSVADTVERRKAYEASGLPRCPWIEEFVFPFEGTEDEQIEASEMLDPHFEQCSACQHRERFLEERFGKPPSLFGPVMTAVVGVVDVVMKVPAPFRPAAAGAAIVGGMTLANMAFGLPALLFFGRDEELSLAIVGMAAVVLLAAMAAGASGGLAWALVAPIRRAFGRWGTYPGGIAAMLAYLGSFYFLGPVVLGEQPFEIRDATDLWLYLAMTVVFGLAVGHGLKEDPEPTETPG